MALLVLPIMLLNLLGGIVGGIWLLFSGEWELVLIAFLYSMFASFLLGFALLPGMIFALPTMWAARKRLYPVLYTLVGLGSLWTYFVIAAYCITTFVYVLGFHTNGSVIPYALIAYSMAIGPWAYMATSESRSGGGDAASFATFAACVGAVLMLLIAIFATTPSSLTYGIAFLIPLIIAWIVQISILAPAAFAEEIAPENQNGLGI